MNKIIIICLSFLLCACTTTKYVPLNIPEASEEIKQSCEAIVVPIFAEGDTAITVGEMLLSEMKAHKECISLNEKKKLWIESLERLNIHK